MRVGELGRGEDEDAASSPPAPCWASGTAAGTALACPSSCHHTEHTHSGAAGALAVKEEPGGPNMDGNVSERQTKEGSPGVTATPPSLVGKPNPGRWLRRAEEKAMG